MHYTTTDLYKRGQFHVQFGKLLMDEKTTLAKLVEFSIAHGFYLDFNVAPLEKVDDNDIESAG